MNQKRSGCSSSLLLDLATVQEKLPIQWTMGSRYTGLDLVVYKDKILNHI